MCDRYQCALFLVQFYFCKHQHLHIHDQSDKPDGWKRCGFRECECDCRYQLLLDSFDQQRELGLDRDKRRLEWNREWDSQLFCTGQQYGKHTHGYSEYCWPDIYHHPASPTRRVYLFHLAYQ